MTEPIFDKINELIERQGFLKLIGIKLEEASPGRVVISVERSEKLLQQQGLLHGGLIATLADVSAGLAAITTMPDGREGLTVELKISYMRPVVAEKIFATGMVIKSGKTFTFVESEITDGSGKLLAKMSGTMYGAPEKYML